MRIIGCDLHASQQAIAMLDRETGEVVERTLQHEGTVVRDFYAGLPPPIVVGIEATGSMGWFLRLMEELGITCHVGDPATIRKFETRRQKPDRRDATRLLNLLSEERFPTIWMPSSELRDLRALLRHREQWVRWRTRVKNALQGLALAHGIRRGAGLWSQRGQAVLASRPRPPHAGLPPVGTSGTSRPSHDAHRRARSGSQRPSRRAAAGASSHDASRGGPGDGVGHRSLPRRAVAMCRRQGIGQLRRDDSERILERRSAATREAHEAGQSIAAISVV
jgi:hypothetical protein